MIEKFISIKNVGRFRDYTNFGDVSFNRLTLISAPNGYGKSTLVAILRSLQTGDADHILGRKSLHGDGSPKIQLRVNGNNYCFSDGKWSSTLPELMIYDEHFVHNNIYLGQAPDIEQRRNLFPVLMGESAASLIQKELDVKRALKENSVVSGNLRTEIKNHIVGSMILERFIKLPKSNDIEMELADAKKQLKQAQQANEIVKRPIPAKLAIPAMPLPNLASVLAASLEGLSGSAEQEVKKWVDSRLDRKGMQWIEQGLGYSTGESEKDCPFCGQDLSGSQLIGLYKTFFNKEYQALKNQVSDALQEIDRLLQKNPASDISTQVKVNSERISLWKTEIDLEDISADISGLEESWQNLITSAKHGIESKRSQLLGEVNESEELRAARTEFNNFRTRVKEYNTALADCIAAIEKHKEKLSSLSVPNAQAKHDELANTLSRHTPEVDALCEKLRAQGKEKDRLDGEKESIRVEINKLEKQIIPAHQDKVNQFLQQMGAAFQLAIRKDFVGGKPNVKFAIEILGTQIESGDSKTPLSQHGFKTILSSGDRSSLAFAFFLSSLVNNPNMKDLVVVLDDPFSSMDNSRQNFTSYITAKLSSLCDQVIALSHCDGFLQRIFYSRGSDEKAWLSLQPVSDDTEIVVQETDSCPGASLERDKCLLQRYQEGLYNGAGSLIPPVIRRTLESALCNHNPAIFQPKGTLGRYLGTIRDCSDTHPANCLKPQYEKLDEINTYCTNITHSSEGLLLDYAEVEESELRNYVGRALGHCRLIAGIPIAESGLA